MEINTISKGYRSFNEDMVIVIKDHLFGVVDGATSLCEDHHKPSDASFLVKEIKEEVLHLYQQKKLNPKNFQKRMNGVAYRIYRKFVRGFKDIKEPYQIPNATMVFCVIDVCDVHIFSLGDVSSFVRFKNGKVKYISDKSVPLRDQAIAEKYQDGLGLNNPEKVAEIRQMRNDVYHDRKSHAFTLKIKNNLKFKHYVFDIRELIDVYLCSDGYYSAFDTYKIFKSRRALFNQKVDLQDVYKSVVKMSESDSKMEKYPRIKPIDDISCIRVTF